MAHSAAHPGLQAHSIGDLYPWSVANKGDRYWFPFNCLTGEKGPEFFYSRKPNSAVTSYDAHTAAEDWIIDQW